METYLIGEISSPKQWKTISSKDLLESGYPVYGANGKIGFYREYTHKNPTLLITCRGATCGTINICEPKSYVNGNAMALDKLSSKVNLIYLKYILQARGLGDVISGSAQPQITRTNLKKVKIPLPSLETQKQIAQILDDAAALRDKTQQLLNEYDQLAQSIFLEMFGTFTSNTNYSKSKIKDVCEKVQKIDKSTKLKNIKYVDISSIDNQRNIITDVNTFPFEKRPSRAQQILKKDDIVYSTVRPNLKNIAIVSADDLIGSSGFAVLRSNRLLNKYYFFWLLKSQGFTKFIMSLVSGANYPAVKQSVFMNLEIPIPPIHLQNQFAEKIALIEQQKDLAKKELQESEDLFQALLQKAFKGELV